MRSGSKEIEQVYGGLEQHFPKWEKIKDMVDQCIDMMLNLRQSGHPGGSRSKVHFMLATMLSGVMRYDIRNPEKRFADRFILVGGRRDFETKRRHFSQAQSYLSGIPAWHNHYQRYT